MSDIRLFPFREPLQGMAGTMPLRRMFNTPIIPWAANQNYAPDAAPFAPIGGTGGLKDWVAANAGKLLPQAPADAPPPKPEAVDLRERLATNKLWFDLASKGVQGARSQDSFNLWQQNLQARQAERDALQQRLSELTTPRPITPPQVPTHPGGDLMSQEEYLQRQREGLPSPPGMTLNSVPPEVE